jgi:hypothetical protein
LYGLRFARVFGFGHQAEGSTRLSTRRGTVGGLTAGR